MRRSRFVALNMKINEIERERRSKNCIVGEISELHGGE